MKNLKFVVQFMTIIMVLSMVGCVSGGGSTRIIVQSTCPKKDLKVEIVEIKNNGKSGTYWNIEVTYTVKCKGEGIEANLYVMLAGFTFKAAKTDKYGKGKHNFAPSSNPTGTEITVKVYGNDDSENPQTISMKVPKP